MKLKAFLFAGILLVPNLTFAIGHVEACSNDGYTVATVNGIFTNQKGAETNLRVLKDIVGEGYRNQHIDYQFFLNPTHLGGAGDLLKVAYQKYWDEKTVDDYDLIEMVKDASEKVTTRKLLLVAHSQGNFYANSFYDIVAGKEGGVPKESLGMYSVATPSNHVSGNGKYLTSGTDKVITILPWTLPPNDSITLHEGDDRIGHSFSDIYLKYRPTEIISDIEWSLDRLRTAPASAPTTPPRAGGEETAGCIDPPKISLAHKVVGVAFAVADPVANVGRIAVVETAVGVNAVGKVATEQGTKAIVGLGALTAKTAELAAVGIYKTGSFVTETSAKVASDVLSAGKFVGGKIAGAFASSPQRFTSPNVAWVAGAFADPFSALSVSGQTQTETDQTQDTSLNQNPNQTDITPHNPNSDILQNVRMSGGQDSGNIGAAEATGAGETSVVLAAQQTNPSSAKEEVKQTPTSTSTTSSATTDTSSPSGNNESSLPITPTSTNDEISSATAPPTTQAVTEFIRRTTGRRDDTTAPESPVITAPNISQTILTTTDVTFVGTAEDASKISTDFSEETVMTSDGIWSLQLTIPQGTTTIQFFATDAAGNRSTASSFTVFVDSVLPDVILTSSTCSGTLSTSACLVATTTLSFSWNSSASDIAYFSIDKNGAVSTTTDTSISVTRNDESTYTFKVTAVDTSDNVSPTSEQIVEIFTKPVVINEIAWAGTRASASDEWVELYNRTGRDISLANVTIYASDLSPYIPLSGTIAAHGYFLIERTDDTTVSTVTADLVAPFSGIGASGLGNSGEGMLLALAFGDATTTIDTVATCGTNWCGGDSSNYKTMERYDSSVSGNISSNWYSHLGEFIRNGADANAVVLNGTPRSRNSVSYLVAPGGTMSADMTLAAANSPYLVNRIGLVVAQGAALTIEPGVVIKIVSNNEPWIRVAGTINANGTTERPVVFTSFNDDEYGGDMNGNGSSTTPQAGNWRRILVDTTSTGSSFTNTLVRYAGNNNLSDSTAKKGAVGVDGAAVTFDGLVVEQSNFHGLSLVNSNSTITNSRFSSSTNSTALASGVYISGGSPTISNSVISGNYRGVTIENATPTVTGNTFTSNSAEAIVNIGVVGSLNGNTGAGNGKNAILIGQGGIITTASATTTLSANDLPYLVKGTATVASGSVLSFGDGVVVKGWDSAQSNNGLIFVKRGATIHSSGTGASDLVFTSMRDSSVGGAVSSSMSAVAPGDWKGIEVETGGRVNLSGFTMKYAGAGAMSFPSSDSIYKGAFKITGSIATSSGSIANALFTNNYQSGLNLDSVSSLAISDVTFQNHTEKNAGTASALYARNSTSTLSGIIFAGNSRDGTGLGVNTISCVSCGTPNTSPANLFSQ